MTGEKHTFLICTVGGSPEPILAALKEWSPVRVRFVPTRETRDQIDARVIPLAASADIGLDPGRYDILELPDGQDFAACVNALRKLTPAVEEWLSRGDDYQAVVDFTGGTKCMSAAIVLQGRRWRCLFSYVGGAERTKEGVGVVVSGREQVLHTHNPWDALGFQAVEECIALFDRQAFSAAAALADGAMRNASDPARKRELNALRLLAEAYDHWDRFDHNGALKLLQKLASYDNDLRAEFGQQKADSLREVSTHHRHYLQVLTEATPPSIHHVQDLLANAERRSAEGRTDDAVGRLYRSIEALAQLRLAEEHQITNTKGVPVESVPEPLRSEWESRSEDGTVLLGLQDAYALLAALGDELGQRFMEKGLHDRKKSPLTARNQSILAHGFERVREKVFQRLRDVAFELADIRDGDVPSFPKLGP